MSEITLDISGMTCAACANRIEKKLNRLEGVSASVNFATEQASTQVTGNITADMLIETVQATGYGASLAPSFIELAAEGGSATKAERAADKLRALRNKLVIAVALSLPVLTISMVPAFQFNYWGWVVGALTTPVVLWAGFGFHRAAWKNLLQRTATMDTLVSTGTLAAYLWSVVALVFGTAGHPGVKHSFEISSLFGGHAAHSDALSSVYFEVAAGVIVFILLGRYFEKRAKQESGAALQALLDLGAREVTVLRGGVEKTISINELQVGDEFLVRPGEKIATDGVVITGKSELDTSLLTGESVLVAVTPGTQVTGATLNTTGHLTVRATRVGADTQLAQMVQLVAAAQSGKAAVQRLADRVSAKFVPIAIGIAIFTCAAWLLSGAGLQQALTAAIAVLIIACPCALGLATPTALLVGTGRGAELGILLRGPEVLEAAHAVDTVVLDKTGTITSGKMAVTQVISGPEVSEKQVLQVAAALENKSEHPIAKAITNAAAAQAAVATDTQASIAGAAVAATVSAFKNLPGLGVTGQVSAGENTLTAFVGRELLLESLNLSVPPILAAQAAQAKTTGNTVVYVVWEDSVQGIIALADTVKDSSFAAVKALRAQGLDPVLLTGDNQQVAEQVAKAVGITSVYAEVLPEEKLKIVQQLQQQGKTVAMVGDGVNDAPALAAADLGIAMGSGTDAAIAAADITLMQSDLQQVVTALNLSERTLKTIRGNLFWAFAYNSAAIPVAAFGLLNPMLAGLAMAASSLFVVGNSLRLRSFKG